jgi:hypothetical protein
MTLLDDVLEAHGGLARWQQTRWAQGALESDGLLFELKNGSSSSPPLKFAVATHEMWSSLLPSGPRPRLDLVADRIALVADDGTVLTEHQGLREAFAGHTMTTPWNALQRGYFSAYALWNYLNLPFLLSWPEVTLRDVEPIDVDGRLLAGIGATFPDAMPTHSREQRFFFDADRLLRRHDYHLDIAGGFAVNHYVSDYLDADGINVPTTRRAYLSDDHGQTRWDQLLVHLRFSDIRFSPALPADTELTH